MNMNKLMMAAAAVAIMAGTGGVLAQQESPRNAPAEKIAPKTPPGETHQNTVQKGAATLNEGADANRKNVEERSDRTKSNERHETTTSQQVGRDSDRKEQRATEEKKSNVKASDERGGGRDRATTGQPTGSAKGENITSENRTRIQQAFAKEGAAPTVDHVDFALSVGTAVPRAVRIVAVPETIIELQPMWRGYEYFMVGDQIVIVDPRSMEIVAVFNV